MTVRFLTISRTYGAGGSEIAALVADQLGWSLLDNNFVERVAARLHTTPAQVQAVEERTPSLAERLATVLSLGAQEPFIAPMPVDLPPPLAEDRLLEVTRAVINDAVSRGPVVIVGRGAQSCLAHREGALHVLCTAERERAIARITARDSLSPTDAADRIDEVNTQRRAYVRRNWGRDWLSPDVYHLCVNTSWKGIEGTASMIARLVAES